MAMEKTPKEVTSTPHSNKKLKVKETPKMVKNTMRKKSTRKTPKKLNRKEN
jgi:hypothetical protein